MRQNPNEKIIRMWTAAAVLTVANAFPCLVICPSSLKINWQREWEKFTDKKAMVLTDKVRDTWTFFYQTGMGGINEYCGYYSVSMNIAKV